MTLLSHVLLSVLSFLALGPGPIVTTGSFAAPGPIATAGSFAAPGPIVTTGLFAAPGPIATAGPIAAPAQSVVHDFHVSYSHLAVEGRVAVLRIRFFKDDLEDVIGRHGGGAGFRMAADPLVDALFMNYFDDHFDLSVGGTALAGRLIGSGEDEVDREPVWWYLVQFHASEPIASLRIRNALMLESFADQKNILKAVYFPGEKQQTFYFAAGEEEATVSFGEG